MNLISEQMLKDLLGVAKTAGSFAWEQATDIVNQALNYALFEVVVALMGTLSLYLFYYIIAKIIKAAEEANKIENSEQSLKTANALKTVRNILFVVFTGVILYRAVTPIKQMGKILISPKVYLIEEGARILDKVRGNPAQTSKVEAENFEQFFKDLKKS